MNYYWNRPEGLLLYNLEYVDWGSQSIVQSKFQRTAPFLGERCSREHSRFLPSILFPNFSEKSFGKERAFLFRLRCRIRVLRERFTEGTAEHGNCVFLIKTFLEKKTDAVP